MDYKSHTIVSTDGVRLAAREWGNPAGKELILVHGIAQCQLIFLKQVQSPLLQRYRIVTFDLRGHGESDKPDNSEFYTDGKRWADDIKSVIDGVGMTKPVLVGWSLGGRVICQFIDVYGDDSIKGINFVGSRTVSVPTINSLGPAGEHLLEMRATRIEVNIAATSKFVRACVKRPLTQEEFELMLAYNMLSPPTVRAAVLEWPGNFIKSLESISVPTLVSHGTADQVIFPSAAELTASKVRSARISWYEDIGHTPHWEDPDRFNSELADFIEQIE
jgi:non-heme chloroperoxidase